MTAATITSLSSTIALALLVPAFVLTLGRLLAGPTTADRVVALDVLSFLTVASVALVAFASGKHVFLDAAVVPALIGFATTAVLASRLLGREDSK